MHAGQILSPTDSLSHMHTEHGELQCGDGGRPAGYCVSVQRGISGYTRQHSGTWHVSHPLITPVVCTNTYSTYLITAQHVTHAGSKKHTNETATESRFTNIDGKARMRNHTQMQRVPEPQLQSAKMISHHH